MTTLDLGELVAHTRVDNSKLRPGLAQGEAEMRASGQRVQSNIIQQAAQWASTLVGQWRNAGRRAADGFWQDMDGRWHDARGRFVSASSVFATAASPIAGALRALGAGATAAAGMVADFGGKIKGVIPWIFLIGAAAVTVAPLLLGFLGALPALLTGGLAAVGALGLGVIGLGDAFKDTTASGGSFVDRARQIMLAQRRVRDANEEVLASQLALTRAQEDASERLEDLNRNLAGARLDQADAQAALARARRDLDRAQEGDNPDQIADAVRAYQRAQHQLEETEDRVGDLEREQTRAAVAGVQGSDEVTSALLRQRAATEGLEDAHYELRRAQTASAGGGGAAAEVTKIAASATAAVAAIKALKPMYESLRLDVQERLFSGSDSVITGLAGAWEPTLRARLGGMASMFNGVFKQWAATSSQPEFIKNISVGWESVERLIGRVSAAIVGPGLEAFGRLSRAAEPFVDALGETVADLIEDWAAWIEQVDKSGDLEHFFDAMGGFFKNTVEIGKDVGRIIGSIFAILFGGQDETKRQAAQDQQSLVESFDKVADWFSDPANQEKVREWTGILFDYFAWITGTAIPTAKQWGDKLSEWADRLGGWADRAVSFKDRVVGAITWVGDTIGGLPGRVAATAAGMWDPIKNRLHSVLTAVVGMWNRSIGSLSWTVPEWVLGLGGKTISAPTLPYPPALAEGGVVRATPGGRVVRVAEAGQDEIVSPVEMMRRIVSEELARIQQSGQMPPEVHVYIGDTELRGMVKVEVREHDRSAKRLASAGSGTR